MSHFILGEDFERAAVVVSRSGGRDVYLNFITRIRDVIISFSFFTIGVSNIIRVLLIEFIEGNFFRKFISPEVEGLIEAESDAFEEEAVLESAPVLEVAFISQLFMEHLHAEREGSIRVGVDLLEVYVFCLDIVERS